MKSVASALFVFCVSSAILASPALAGPPPAPKPDLVITSFGLQSWGVCAPGKDVFTFAVTVKNQGTASWSGLEPAVVVSDLHPGGANQWATGAGIDPPLAPGQSRTVTVPVSYFAQQPTHMTGQAPHPFQAVVNGNHALAESNFNNNTGPGPATWNGVKVIMVGAPKGCPK